MNKLFLALCAVVGLGFVSSGCGTTPIQACNSFEVEVCARVYECYDGPTKASAAFVAMYGASQSECESKLKSANCATTTNDTFCQGATKFHQDKSDACMSDLKAASCATITGGTFSSGNCAAVCS